MESNGHAEQRQSDVSGYAKKAIKFTPGLYLVATPIGNARDITLRALDILAGVDLIAAEDTRQTRKLLDIHGIGRDGRSMLPYHDHNGAAQRPRILRMLEEGKSVALVSDAGTPMIADPGFPLVRAASEAGHNVFAAPGASAVLCALAIAGLPTDRFLFSGFLPPKEAARRVALGEIAQVPATLVFYESPRRLAACLSSMISVLGPDRQVAVCRELTKKFEEARRGTLGDLADFYAAGPAPKGEVVIVVGPPLKTEVTSAAIDTALSKALAVSSVKDAATEVATSLGIPRRQAYSRALLLNSEK